MVNKNYNNGANKERRIVNQLKKAGYDIAFRSAGSHSPIDCVAIHRKKREILFIQSKPKDMSQKAKDKIFDEQSWLWDTFRVTFEVR